jgi:hypothetical protein
VVCGWIGNTERIARRHYLQITEADFDQAIGLQSGLQRAAKSAAISSSEYAQLAQDETKEPRFPAENAVNAVPQLSSFAQDRGRTVADSTEKSSDSAKGAAKSAAIDPMLAELLARWNNLPRVIKSAILAVARQRLPKD